MGHKPVRRAIIVVGMHRSGTSALTRMMNILGATLPSVLAQPDLDSKETNDLGFWEGAHVNDLNNAFLSAIGSDWNSTSRIDESVFRSDAALRMRDRITDHLETEFANAPLFVLKDPRIARIAPLWVDALRVFGAEPNFVIAIRNPLEVAGSLLKRNGVGRGAATLLWLRYMLDAERYTRNFRRCFVSYEAVLDNWRREARRVANDCGFEWPRFNAGAEMEIDYFLSADRRHNVASHDSVQELPVWIRDTYAALEQASRESVFDVGTADRVLSQLDVADATYDRVVRELDFGMRDHSERREQASRSLAALAAQGAGLEARAGAAEAERDRIVAEYTAMAVHWQSVADERDRIGADLAEAQGALAARETQLADISANLAARGQIEADGPEREAAEARRAELEASLAAARAEYDALAADYELKTAAWQAVSYERDKARLELTDTSRALDEMHERHEAAVAERATVESELQARRDAQAALEAKLRALDDARLKEMAERGHTEAELARSRVLLVETERAVEALRVELADRSADVESTVLERDQALAQVVALNQALGGLEQRIVAHTGALGNAESARDAAQGERNALEADLRARLAERAPLETELRIMEEARANEAAEGEQARAELARAEGRLADITESLASLRAELENRARDVEHAHAERDDANARIESLAAELTDYAQRLAGADIVVGDLSQRTRTVSEERDRALQHAAEFEAMLQGRDETLRDVRGELTSRMGELDQARAEVAGLSDALAGLQVARGEADQLRAGLAKQFGRLQVEFRKQEEALAASVADMARVRARQVELEAGAVEIAHELAEVTAARDDARHAGQAERDRLNAELDERIATMSEMGDTAQRLAAEVAHGSNIVAALEAKSQRLERVAQAVPLLRRKLDELHDRSDRETRQIAELGHQVRIVRDDAVYQARRAQIASASVAAARIALASAHRELAARDALISALTAKAATERRGPDPSIAVASSDRREASPVHADPARPAPEPIRPRRWLAKILTPSSRR